MFSIPEVSKQQTRLQLEKELCQQDRLALHLAGKASLIKMYQIVDQLHLLRNKNRYPQQPFCSQHKQQSKKNEEKN